MASGDTLYAFLPINNEPPSTGNATFDIRNTRVCIDFDGIVQEYAVFTGYMPNYYTGSGIKALVHHAATSGTTGTIGWKICFERIGSGIQDLDSDGFSAETTIGLTTVSNNPGDIDIVQSNIPTGTGIDNIGAGELFRVKISRDILNDDLAGDAELYAIELREL